MHEDESRGWARVGMRVRVGVWIRVGIRGEGVHDLGL